MSLSTKDCGRDILYYDVTSEYPFVNARKQYPVGHPVAMLKHECPQSNETWKKANLFGNVRCSILPPGQLLHPVLPYRQNGALMFPLCHTCCREKRESFCPHSDVERTLHGTWPTIEIDRAVKLGYTIVRVEEVAHFNRRSSDLFTISYTASTRTSLRPLDFLMMQTRLLRSNFMWRKFSSVKA